MKVKPLPKGELFWRVESFPTLDEAKAAAPPYRWNPDPDRSAIVRNPCRTSQRIAGRARLYAALIATPKASDTSIWEKTTWQEDS